MPNVPMYRHGKRQTNTPADALSAWMSIPAPPPALDERGACRGHSNEGFFLETPSRTDPRLLAAKALCATCPVKVDCLKYAMSLPQSVDYGLWGGLTRHERNKIRSGNSRG